MSTLISPTIRLEELFDRAIKRDVFAIIHMQAPSFQDGDINPLTGGVFQGGGNEMAQMNIDPTKARGASVWKFTDQISIPLMPNPKLMDALYNKLLQRTQAMSEQLLTPRQSDALYDSEDIVDEIIEHYFGVEKKITLDFTDAAIPAAKKIEAQIPYIRLRDYMHILHTRVSEIGGELVSMDAIHGPSTSAYDYDPKVYDMSREKWRSEMEGFEAFSHDVHTLWTNTFGRFMN